MNYIIIDLEWNQCPAGKEGELKNLPFEIIEIGAVKLDSMKKTTGRFHEVIRPQHYTKIHPHTLEIIHVDLNAMKHGDTFPNVIRRFFKWCGENFRFCTWGPSDLTELQRNMDYYQISDCTDKVILYYDVQKLFSLVYEGKKNPHSLEYAVDFLKLEKKEAFHNALSDADYTASVFQLLDDETVREYYSVNYYHNPKTKKEEITLIYKTYLKHISREFNTKEEALHDRDVRSTVCYLCAKPAAKKIRWFSPNSKTYYCLACCREHGYIKGKLTVKKTADGHYLTVKILKPVTEQEAEDLSAFRQKTIEKRRLKGK